MWKYIRFGVQKWTFNHHFLSTLVCFCPCNLPTYLPTCLQKIIFDNYFQIKLFKHGHKFDWSNGSLFVNQNDQSNGPYYANKKDHPNHTRHVKIDLSKMIREVFWPLSKFGLFYHNFWLEIFILKIMNGLLFNFKKKIHFNFSLAIGLLIHSIEMNFIHMNNDSTPRLIIQ
jgi:hypothetical protein